MEYGKSEQSTIEAIQGCKCETKHCLNNALYHIEKAWKIKDIDLEMAVFRGITAEEEAASAIFHCLKKHRYQNAKKIQFKKHPTKLGLYPFLVHIYTCLYETYFAESGPFEKFRLGIIEISNRKAVELILKLKDQNFDARPRPPLHFTVSTFNTEDPLLRKPIMYDNDFKEKIQRDGRKKVWTYIVDIANRRNTVLYANSGGTPKVTGDVQKFLISQKDKVFLYSYIVLLIDPWEKAEGSSSFVQQVLDSYLLLLERINEEEISSFPSSVA
ncbi:hypothetical protein VU10_00690 [Desulfobulbus sp. US1]|nr:hypothetical protein [Desulfobulbus sp. US4]MCW5208738.1 hypothetical protein [Desulfobulbus sp. US1]